MYRPKTPFFPPLSRFLGMSLELTADACEGCVLRRTPQPFLKTGSWTFPTLQDGKTGGAFLSRDAVISFTQCMSCDAWAVCCFVFHSFDATPCVIRARVFYTPTLFLPGLRRAIMCLLESSTGAEPEGMSMRVVTTIRNVCQRLHRWHRNRGSDERAERFQMYVQNMTNLMWQCFKDFHWMFRGTLLTSLILTISYYHLSYIISHRY